MKHSSHPHELYVASHMVSHNQTLKCFGCQLTVSGTCYACSRCNFYLHKACFELPQSARLDSHPKHTLRLVYPPDCQGRPCDACGESCNGFTYNCSYCKYNVQPNCATLLHSKPRNDRYYYKKTSPRPQRVEEIEIVMTSQVGSSDVRSRMQQLVEEREYLREMEMLEELERMKVNMELQFMKNISDTMDSIGKL